MSPFLISLEGKMRYGKDLIYLKIASQKKVAPQRSQKLQVGGRMDRIPHRKPVLLVQLAVQVNTPTLAATVQP